MRPEDQACFWPRLAATSGASGGFSVSGKAGRRQGSAGLPDRCPLVGSLVVLLQEDVPVPSGLERPLCPTAKPTHTAGGRGGGGRPPEAPKAMQQAAQRSASPGTPEAAAEEETPPPPLPLVRRRSQSRRSPAPIVTPPPPPVPCRPTPAVERPEAEAEPLPDSPSPRPASTPGMPATRNRRPPALGCRLAGGRPGPKPSSSSSGDGGDGEDDGGSGSSCPPEERPAPAPPRLGPGYFDQPCVRLARALLGQVLVRQLPGGEELRARIVETEAYLGGEDSASHSRGGRQTPRNAAMFMPPGTLYVYQIYGIYFCMNISSQGEGAAVLLRSLEPLQGQEAMRRLRLAQRKGPTGILKDWQLCNGPSKLCQALGVDKTFDRQDLPSHPFLWLEAGKEVPREDALVSATRVGISGDWAHKPLRFYIRGNRCVSTVDRKAEQGNQSPS